MTPFMYRYEPLAPHTYVTHVDEAEFDALLSGSKSFIIRKYNSSFKTGDKVIVKDPLAARGWDITHEVTHVCSPDELKSGGVVFGEPKYIILSLRNITGEEQ